MIDATLSPWNLSLTRAPSSAVYLKSGCGTSTSTTITMGLSVGWSDVYGWSIARQWIDTTGLPLGRYLVCSTADPSGEWREMSRANNQSWALVELYRDSAGADQVRLVSSRRADCASQLPAPTPSPTPSPSPSPSAAGNVGGSAAAGTRARPSTVVCAYHQGTDEGGSWPSPKPGSAPPRPWCQRSPALPPAMRPHPRTCPDHRRPA